MTPFVAIGLLFLFLLIGLPIYLSLGFLALLLFWHEGTPLISLPQLLVDHLNSETLLAIPLFVIAATFMQKGGVAGALIDCAQAWVGRARGGLALVSVVACTIFAAICGSDCKGKPMSRCPVPITRSAKRTAPRCQWRTVDNPPSNGPTSPN